MAQRESHHAGITALQGYHRAEAGILDGISAGLVKRITGGNVGIDFVVAVGPHGHIRDAQVGHQAAIRQPQHGQAGVHLVAAPAQGFQHFHRLGHVPGLAQDTVSIDHGGIGRHDDQVVMRRLRAGARFALGQPQHVGSGRFAGALALVHVRRPGVEHPAAQRQQFAPPGTVGCQYQQGFGHVGDSNTNEKSPLLL